jgi:hypothetical protein
MDETGLLASIFPDLKRLKGCVQNRHHHYDVFEHTMKAYDCLEMIINDLAHFFPNTAMPIYNHIDENKIAFLKCAILLHDIGKPSVKTLDKGDIVHFYGHAKKSADMARNIGKRLKFAARETNFIDFIIRNHMRPLFLFAAHQKKALKRRGLTRFFIKCGDDTPYLLLHTIADIMSKRYDVTKKKESFISFIENVMDDFFNKFKPKSKTPPLISGYDLIHVFNLPPSPLFKTILNMVQEAKLENRIQSRGDALSIVREFLKDS